MEEARAHALEILKIKPDYTVEFYCKITPYEDKAYLDTQGRPSVLKFIVLSDI